jgi:hypothetical protein
MQADEFQELKSSIEINGVLNAVTLYQRMVLDGWHRYRAATELGMECPSVELGDIDPRDFVLAQNKARRNLTASQRAAAVTSVYQWRPHGDQRSAVTADRVKTTKELAVIAGVGARTIEQAKVVHAGATKSVQEAVKTGTVSVEVAAAVAKLPAKTQDKIAAKGPDAMRAAAKPAKGKPASKPIALTETQLAAQQNAADANGDVDPVAMWEAAEKQVVALQAEIDAAQADDQKAETLRWKRLCANAERQRDDAMLRAVRLEGELKRFSRQLQRICKAVGEDDTSKVAAIVEAKFRAEKGEA